MKRSSFLNFTMILLAIGLTGISALWLSQRVAQDEPTETPTEAATVQDLTPNRFVKAGATGDCMTVDTACGSIQEAVDSVEAGVKGVVAITEGTYTEENEILIQSDISLLGGFSLNFETRDPKNYITFIDGQEDHRIIHIDSDIDTISGITFQNGKCSSEQDGGAIYINTPNVKNVNRISDNIFKNNKSYSLGGGAIMLEGYLTLNTLENNLFESNYADSKGGAIYIYFSTINEFKKNSFVNNRIAWKNSDRGAAISIFWGKIENFSNNFFQDNNNSDSRANTINVSTKGKINYGYNNIFYRTNQRITNELYVSPYDDGENCYINLSNTMFYSLQTNNNAINISRIPDDVVLKNTVIYGYTNSINNTTSYEIQASNIWYSGELLGNINCSNCVKGTEPKLVDPANKDLHYRINSELIDSGTNDISLNYDYDGNYRPIDGNCDLVQTSDIGPYEFQTTCAPSNLQINLNPIPGNQTTNINYTFTGSVTSNYSIEYVKYKLDNGSLKNASVNGSNYSFSVNNMGIGNHSLYIEAKDIQKTVSTTYSFNVIEEQDDPDSTLTLNLNKLPNNKTTNRTYTFRGTSSSNYPIEYIKYSYDGGEFNDVIRNGNTFTLTISNMLINTHSLYIKAKDTKKIEEISYNFSVVQDQIDTVIDIPISEPDEDPKSKRIFENIQIESDDELVFSDNEMYIEEKIDFEILGEITSESIKPVKITINIDNKEQKDSVYNKTFKITDKNKFSFDIPGLEVGEYLIKINGIDSEEFTQSLQIKAFIKKSEEIEQKKDEVEIKIEEQKERPQRDDTESRFISNRTVWLGILSICSILALGVSIIGIVIYERYRKKGKLKSPFHRKHKRYFK